MKITVSKHGTKRAFKRMGISKKSVVSAVENAFEKGLGQKDVVGRLKKYMDAKAMKGGGNMIKIFNRFVWVFSKKGKNKFHLVTCYNLPSEYHKLEDVAKERNQKDERTETRQDSTSEQSKADTRST